MMRLSIKVKQIIYSLCIGIVPISVITIVFYLISTTKLESHQFEEMRAIAESKRIHTRDLMEAIKLRATDLSTDRFIRTSFEEIIREDTRQLSKITELSAYISQRKLPLYQHLLSITLIDKTGNVVSSTSEEFTETALSEQDVDMQMTEGEYEKRCSVVIRFSSFFQKTCLIVFAPVTSTRNNEPIGVIADYYDIAVLGKITANRVGMGKTGEVYLVDNNKKMLTVSRFIEESPHKLVVDTLPVQKILEEKKEMVGVYPDYRGIPVVGASLHLPEYGWILLTEIDKAEVYAPIKKLGTAAIISGAIAGAIAVFIGLINAYSILRPIRQLRYTIENYQGNIKRRAETGRNDEIGDLACSFNRMAEELEEEIRDNKNTHKQLQKFFHTIKQCTSMVVLTDTKGNIEYVNPMFFVVTGYSPEEVAGKNSRILQSGKTPQEKYRKLWETILSGGIWKGELLNKKKNGELYWESLNISSIKDNDGNISYFVKISEDITVQKQVRRRLDTQHAVISALAHSATLKDASVGILQSLCLCLEWDFSGLWLYDLKTNVLKCVELWHNPFRHYPKFKAMSKQIAFSPGIGLPGRVWQSAKPKWISDVVSDENFPRHKIAKEEGLHGAFGFPIMRGKEVLGVIEFFNREIKQPDEDLLNMMSDIGSQLGQYIKQKQMGEQLHKLSLVIEQSQNMVIITDFEGNIEYINPMFTKITGYEPNEIIGKNPGILKSGKTPPEKYKTLWDTILSGGNWQGELLNKKKNGDLFWESLTITPILKDNKTRYFAKISEDITDKKRLKSHLDMQYSIVRLLAESSSLKDANMGIIKTVCKCLKWDIGAIWTYDKESNALRCLDIWHVPLCNPAEFIETNKQISFPYGVGLPGRVWKTGKPVWISDVISDKSYFRASIAEKEGLRGAFGFPIKYKGKILGVIDFLSREIRQPDDELLTMMDAVGGQIGQFLKRHQIEEHAYKLSRVVEEGTSSVIITDKSGKIEYVNPRFSELTGYAADEVIGRNPNILKSGKTPKETYKRLWDAVSSGREWQGEFQNRKKSGELFCEFASIFPIKDKDNVITNLIAIKEDITERKELENALKRLNESLEQRVEARTKELSLTHDRLQIEIKEHKRLEKERNRKIQDMILLSEYSCLMNNETDEKAIIKHMGLTLKENFMPDTIAILIFNKKENILDIPFIYPPAPLNEFVRKEVILDCSLCRVMRTGQNFIVRDIEKDISCECLLYELKKGGYMCVPLTDGGTTIGIVTMIKKDKGYFDIEENRKLLTTYVDLSSNAIQRVRLVNIIKHAAITDGLTGIYNRRFFDEMLVKLLAVAKRRKEALGLLMIDLDHFKNINDTYGHAVGDLVLMHLSEGILNTLRSSDILTRYGGEEFSIILPETNMSGAVEKARLIRQHVESIDLHSIMQGKSLKITVSIGVASYPEFGNEREDLVKAADKALYKAKANGRNRVEAP